MEQLDETYDDAVRLLTRAIEEQEWAIAKDLLRFLRSMDDSGGTLTSVMKRAGLDVDIDEVPVNL
jgi:RAB6A-GEF complex partner protein 1